MTAFRGRTWLLVVFVGAGCGGPPAGKVPEDRTAPAIRVRVPAIGSREGTPSDPALLVFSEALDPSASSTVQAEFHVDGSVIPASVSLGQGNSLIFLQKTPFGFRSRVDVRLKGQVKDLAGNVLSLDGEGWSFDVPTFDQLAHDLPYQLCGMVQQGSNIWLSDCYGVVRMAPDGGTGPRIGPPGYVDFFVVQSPPGEIFVFAETDFLGTARSSQLFRLDAGADTLEPAFPPLAVDADALSWILATDPAHPVAALSKRPNDPGLGELLLFQWSGNEWAGLTRPISSRASLFVAAADGLYAFLEPAADGVSVGTARVESDGGWTPVGEHFPVDAMGVDAHGTLVRSGPWYRNHRLERWNGTVWDPIGEYTFQFPAIRFAFDSQNVPVVVTLEPGGFAVRRLTAAGWRMVGEPFPTVNGHQFNIFISFDPDDRAIVAWSDGAVFSPVISFVARETR